MTEPEAKKRGWTVPILSAVAALLFVAFLIVPGYIAGYYCRLTKDGNSMITIDVELYHGSPPGPKTALELFIVPACLAIKIVPRLKGIYMRQFNTAAGNTHP